MERITADDSRFKIGVKYDDLEIIGELYYRLEPREQRHRPYCRVRCRCGEEFDVQCFDLRKRKCCRKCRSTRVAVAHLRHGETHSRLYYVWRSMLQRCLNKKSRSFKNYGARGVRVCSEWQDFMAFRDWAMQNGYRDDLEIDRVDNDGGYEPQNCRWVTEVRQGRNKRNNVRIQAFGEEKCLTEWVDDPRCVVHYHCLRTRLLRGWEPEHALTCPPRPI